MPLSQYSFLFEYISDKNIEQQKNQLIAASYCAWQIGRFQGLQMDWPQYIRSFGLIDKPEITERQARETSSIGLRILKKLGKI
jgi:hypothetical protein